MTGPIRRVNRGTWHQYFAGKQPIPGVTTILNAGLPKPALVGWAARTCGEYVVDHWDDLAALEPSKRLDAVRRAPDEARNRAAARGTDIHRLAEALIAGGLVEIPDHLAGPVEAYARFLDRWHIEPVHVEATVFNRQWWYAGTLDLIATIADPDSPPWLLDIKTGAGVYDDTAMQLAAYRYADVIVTDQLEQPMPPVQGVRVAHVLPDDVELIPVDADRDAYRAFLHVLQTYRWTKQIKDAPLLGAPLAPPEPPHLEVVQ